MSRYLTARRVLQALDGQNAQELDGVMAKLQIEASRLVAKPDEVVVARHAGAAASSIAGSSARSRRSRAPTWPRAMLRGIFADAPQIAERGERAAEQAAMAAEVLATAIAKARGQDANASKDAFAELFKQFEAPSAYEPSRFVAAMKRVEAAVPNR